MFESSLSVFTPDNAPFICETSESSIVIINVGIGTYSLVMEVVEKVCFLAHRALNLKSM